MKKILLVLFVLVITINMSFAFADGEPEVNYSAKISNPNGANYYITANGSDVIGGKIRYGETINIYYESEDYDEAYTFYFITQDETQESKWQSLKKINKEDVTIETKNLQLENYILSDKEETLVIINPTGVRTYTFPGLIYAEKERINQGERIIVKHVESYGDNNWYYITDKNVFVHYVKGKYGYGPEREIITSKETNFYRRNTMTDSDIILQFEPGTPFGDYIRVEKDYYYVSAYERDGFVKYEDMAFKSNGETSEIWFLNTNLYKEADFNSNIVYSDLPLYTEIAWEYNTDMTKYGWVRTTYKNFTGWTFVLNPIYLVDESDENVLIRDEYFEVLRQGEGREVNLPSDPDNKPQVTPTSGNPLEPPKENPVQKEEKVDIRIVIIACSIGVIIVLILIIAMLLKKNAWYKKRYRIKKRKW